jgi:hypothetical protein
MKLAIRFLALVAIAALCIAQAAAQNSKPAGPPCSLDRQAGDWAFEDSGTTAGSDYMATGTYHLNNDGTSSAHIWLNNGSAFLEFDRFGNTTIKEDCTLTQTWNDGGPLAKCVILDDGNEIWCLYDQPAYDRTTLKRIHTRN